MSKIPSTYFYFSAEAEEGFDDWFHGDYGPYTLRSEYFYGDCAEEDLKTLEKAMYQWVHVAFVTGYERGCFATQNAEDSSRCRTKLSCKLCRVLPVARQLRVRAKFTKFFPSYYIAG